MIKPLSVESPDHIVVREAGILPYERVWRSMQAFVDARVNESPDELWVLQHDPVFTLGQAGKKEHLLRISDVPVIQSDRGGQVTYHGPGQIMVYALLDLKRNGLTIRQLVSVLEQTVMDVLRETFGLSSFYLPEAPGVYLGSPAVPEKIAALGLRVRRGFSYHGLSMNVDLDLKPFTDINPCGYKGLRVTRLQDRTDQSVSPQSVGRQLADVLAHHLGYNHASYKPLSLELHD